MAFLDFGLSSGLAYKYNADKDIDDANKMYIMKRQARIDQENKARLLGDKFKFGHADDPYNEARLDQYTEKQMTNIGKFVHENPNFQRDPALWAQFNRMSNSLLDNPIVTESMRIKAHRDAMDKYIQETPGAAELPDIQRMQQQYDRYTKTGSITDNPADRKEFMFYNPDDLIDTGKYVAEAFGKVEPNRYIHGANGSVKQVPYQEEVGAAADRIMNNAPVNIKLTKEWNAVKDSDEMKRLGITNYRDYIIHVGKSYLPTKFDKGFAPDRSGSSSGSGQTNFNVPADIWRELHLDAYNLAKAAASTGRGNSATFTIPPEQQGDIFGIQQNGETMMTFKDGIPRGKDGTELDANALNGTYRAIPTGEMRVDYIPAKRKGDPDQARYYQTVQVMLPYDDAFKVLKEKNFFGPNYFEESAAATYHNNAYKTGDVSLTDKGNRFFNLHDDNGRPAVGVYVDVPYDMNQKGLGEKFNHSYGAPGNQFGTDKRNYQSMNEQERNVIIQQMKQAVSNAKSDDEMLNINGVKITAGELKKRLTNAGQ